MSTLGEIAVAALKPAASMLGPNGQASSLSIDSGPPWEGTKDQARVARDYMEGGQQIELTQTFVGASSEFVSVYTDPADDYLGKTAILDGEARKVESVEVGEAMTLVSLTGTTQAP